MPPGSTRGAVTASGLGVYGRYQSTRHYVNDNDADGFQTWRINTAHTLMKMRHWTLTMNIGVDNLFNYVDRTPFGRNRAASTPGSEFLRIGAYKVQERGRGKIEKNIFFINQFTNKV